MLKSIAEYKRERGWRDIERKHEGFLGSLRAIVEYYGTDFKDWQPRFDGHDAEAVCRGYFEAAAKIWYETLKDQVEKD